MAGWCLVLVVWVGSVEEITRKIARNITKSCELDTLGWPSNSTQTGLCLVHVGEELGVSCPPLPR